MTPTSRLKPVLTDKDQHLKGWTESSRVNCNRTARDTCYVRCAFTCCIFLYLIIFEKQAVG